MCLTLSSISGLFWKGREPRTSQLIAVDKDVCCFVVLVAKLCLTFWDLMDFSPSGSSIHGISQARILDWVALSSSRGSSQLRDQTCISCIDGWILSPLSQQGSPDKDTAAAAAAAKSLQSCPILCDPIDSSPPGSPIPGILQARTPEWKVKVKSLSRVRLLVTPWTIAHKAPLSMGFPRQEYWRGLPFPSPDEK